MSLLSYVLTSLMMNQPLPTWSACALDCLFLHTVHKNQSGYECFHIPLIRSLHNLVTGVPTTPALIATINNINKSHGIQNLKITDCHGHLLFDSSMDPALLARVDD